jgi:hypothetical protein
MGQLANRPAATPAILEGSSALRVIVVGSQASP